MEVASIQNEQERQSILTAKIVERVKGQTETNELSKSLTPYIGGAIKPLVELLIGSLYKFYYDRHNTQRQLVADFEDVVTSLKKLGLLAPFLSLAFCPSCNNYELGFSRLARFSPKCGKCGSDWPVLIVNEFAYPFADLKKKSKDLPVFISAYLKSRSALPVEVFPNAELSSSDGKFEVDVFIPDTATGIECKCYTHNLVVTESTISSEAGQIRKQIENYLALGIKRVIVITNYGDADTNKLRVRLEKLLKGVKSLDEWKVLGSDVTAFVEFLKEEAKKIADARTERVQKEFDHRIAHSLGQQSNEENP